MCEEGLSGGRALRPHRQAGLLSFRSSRPLSPPPPLVKLGRDRGFIRCPAWRASKKKHALPPPLACSLALQHAPAACLMREARGRTPSARLRDRTEPSSSSLSSSHVAQGHPDCWWAGLGMARHVSHFSARAMGWPGHPFPQALPRTPPFAPESYPPLLNVALSGRWPREQARVHCHLSLALAPECPFPSLPPSRPPPLVPSSRATATWTGSSTWTPRRRRRRAS